MASVSSCVREESWAGRSLWLLPPALTSNPVWFKEEGVGGSAEALDDGVLLPRSPVPPPSSCSLTDMPFIILLLLMLCFSHRALWDRAQSTHRADREGEREWERGGRVPPWFPKPCSPEPQTERARPQTGNLRRWRSLEDPHALQTLRPSHQCSAPLVLVLCQTLSFQASLGLRLMPAEAKELSW